MVPRSDMLHRVNLNDIEIGEGNNIRVTPIKIGDEFKQKGTPLFVHRPFPDPLDGLLACDNIHAVHLHNWVRQEQIRLNGRERLPEDQGSRHSQ